MFLAAVLFLVGIGSSFKLPGVRYALVAFGSVLLIFSIVPMLRQPGLPKLNPTGRAGPARTEVLRLVAEGRSNSATAAELFLGVGTVRPTYATCCEAGCPGSRSGRHHGPRKRFIRLCRKHTQVNDNNSKKCPRGDLNPARGGTSPNGGSITTSKLTRQGPAGPAFRRRKEAAAPACPTGPGM